jgi:acetylornithine/N-succinyldiaminopimelate aminotransferase
MKKTSADKEAELIELHEQFVMPNYAPERVLVRGCGSYVWDIHGKRYLDFVTGLAVNTLGHCPPEVVDAIRVQSKTLMHTSNLYYNTLQPRLAEKLSKISLGGKVFFCNSGAEANEGLIKLARLWGSDQGRHEIITFRNSFHGRTLATLTATGQDKVQKGFAPLPEGFKYADLNNIESVKNLISTKTAAVLIEPIQGESGVRPTVHRFMRELRELCSTTGVLLFCDEIQAGIGRTGTWFAYEHGDIRPDAISVAKGLGNGFPIGAVLTSPALSNVFQPGTHGTTFGGTPLACAAALAVLETIEKKHLLESAAEKGDQLLVRLQKLTEKFDFVEEVRGRGLMLGIQCNRPVKELEQIMARRGLITVATSGNVIRLLPPLNVSAAQIKRAVRIIFRSCTEWKKTQTETQVV